MSTLDHVGIRTSQLEELVIFYEAALAPLGYSKLIATEEGASFGVNALPAISIVKMPAPGRGLNFGIRFVDRAGVDAFYATAKAHGATSRITPRLIAHIHPHYYSTIVEDPDGNNITVVCHEPQSNPKGEGA